MKNIDEKLREFGVILPVDSESRAIEVALLPVTAKLNSTPLQVNRKIWLRNHDTLVDQHNVAIERCRKLVGNPEFRPNSTKDCAEAFRARDHEPWTTKAGRDSIDKDLLTIWANQGDKLAIEVLAARGAGSKLSQLKAWAPYADAGSVQAQWNQAGTPHGRYSCENPNLQNRIDEIRETIEPPEGWSFLSMDLGQAELVTWASLSGDPSMTAVFKNDADLHAVMGAVVEKATPNLPAGKTAREVGKTTNLALLYGMIETTLAQRLGCDVPTAEAIMSAVKESTKVAQAYKRKVLAEFERSGQVSTYFGRTRSLKIQGVTGSERHETLKTAWHHHNAGTAAELLKRKQIRVDQAIERAHLSDAVRPALQMHDEIILMVRDDVLELATSVARTAFEQPDEPRFIPFKTDLRTGKNWFALSK